MICCSVLLITSVKNKEPYFVTHKDLLPTVSITDLNVSSLAAARGMLKHITDVDAFDEETGGGWALLKLNYIDDNPEYLINNERVMYIIYSVSIPETIKINEDYTWTPLNKINTLNVVDQEFIKQAVKRL